MLWSRPGAQVLTPGNADPRFALPSPPFGSLSLEPQIPLSLSLAWSRESQEPRKGVQQPWHLLPASTDHASGRKQQYQMQVKNCLKLTEAKGSELRQCFQDNFWPLGRWKEGHTFEVLETNKGQFPCPPARFPSKSFDLRGFCVKWKSIRTELAASRQQRGCECISPGTHFWGICLF